MKTKFLLLAVLVIVFSYAFTNKGQSQKTEAPKVSEVKPKLAAPIQIKPEPTPLDTLEMNLEKLEKVPEKIDALGATHLKTKKVTLETDVILDSISSKIAAIDTQKVIIIVEEVHPDTVIVEKKAKKFRFFDIFNFLK